jgi:peroxiredoxin
MRDMSQREEEYKAKGVEIVAVSVFEEQSVAREWMASSGLDYRWTFADDSVTEAFGVDAIPTQILLDREGRVVWTSSLTSVFGGADAVFAAIDEAL